MSYTKDWSTVRSLYHPDKVDTYTYALPERGPREMRGEAMSESSQPSLDTLRGRIRHELSLGSRADSTLRRNIQRAGELVTKDRMLKALKMLQEEGLVEPDGKNRWHLVDPVDDIPPAPWEAADPDMEAMVDELVQQSLPKPRVVVNLDLKLAVLKKLSGVFDQQIAGVLAEIAQDLQA